MLRLREFWRSLSQDAELKRDLAQPAPYTAVWLIPLGLLVAGVLMVSQGVLVGLLVAAGGAGAGWWMQRQQAAAEEAREVWERAMYCRACPAMFEPWK